MGKIVRLIFDMKNYCVLICTYNGQEYIIEQIESILNQTLKPKKIYINDDCSTDNTVNLVFEYIDSISTNIEFEILINNENKGYSRNFLESISKCEEDIILFSDQDDVWVENKADLFIENFYTNPSKNLIFSDAYITDAKLNPTEFSLSEILGINKDKINFNETFIKRNIVTGAVMGIRRSWFMNISSHPSNVPHDYWLASVASLTSSILWIDEKTIYYRQHGKNILGAKKLTFKERLSNLFSTRFFKNREKTIKERFNISKLLSNYENKAYIDFIYDLNLIVSGKPISLKKYYYILRMYKKFDFGYKYIITDIILHIKNKF